MGGDGGVIASNRRYMRGAGTADHTADATRREKHRVGLAAEREAAQERMTTCAISKAPLDFFSSKQQIVVCPYGRLYHREAALEALLRRKQQQKEDDDDGGDQSRDELGKHVRGLKDLYPARFEAKKNSDGVYVPVCPVTGVELNGQIPAFLIVSKSQQQHEDQPNVVSERAIKEMGMDSLQAEHGPFAEDDMVRLVPPASMMESIQEKLSTKRAKEKLKKAPKKDGKKRKKNSQNGDGKVKSAKTTATNTASKDKANGSVAEAARKRVESAVASNTVLSSLFTSERSSVSKYSL